MFTAPIVRNNNLIGWPVFKKQQDIHISAYMIITRFSKITIIVVHLRNNVAFHWPMPFDGEEVYGMCQLFCCLCFHEVFDIMIQQSQAHDLQKTITKGELTPTDTCNYKFTRRTTPFVINQRSLTVHFVFSSLFHIDSIQDCHDASVPRKRTQWKFNLKIVIQQYLLWLIGIT